MAKIRWGEFKAVYSTSYSVGPHPVSSLHIYTFVVSRAFMAGAASQAGDADSSRAPGLTSGLQGSMNVHRSALLLVPQWQCISCFVFFIGMDPLFWGLFKHKIVIFYSVMCLLHRSCYLYRGVLAICIIFAGKIMLTSFSCNNHN